MTPESTMAVVNVLDSRDIFLTQPLLEKNTTKKSTQPKTCYGSALKNISFLPTATNKQIVYQTFHDTSTKLISKS